MAKTFRHNVVAIVYDFDGTLTPQPMQEYTILPQIGIHQGSQFWNEVNRQAAQYNGEDIATYMRLMIEKSKSARYPVTAEKLAKLATKIKYFPGVQPYFARINAYVRKLDPAIELRHYIISAGLKEIICGAAVSKYFYKVFASQYYYDEYGAATFPNVIVNDTLKTQFIFRINKGKEKLSESINLYMPPQQRPVPFENILYIGDGLTDVPCMTVIKKNGGYAIAVYKSRDTRAKKTCRELLKAKRVDFIAQANYKTGSELDRLIKLQLQTIVQGVRYARESFNQAQRYDI